MSANSTYRDNWALSAARAADVAKLMMAMGIDEHMLAISGYGPSRLLLPETDVSGKVLLENRRKNRRIEIRLIKKG